MASSEIVTLKPPDTSSFRETGLCLRDRAAALLVIDADSHQAALEEIREATKYERSVDDLLGPWISLLNKHHKAGTKLRSDLKLPAEEARAVLQNKVSVYEAEARRIAEEESRRLEEEARKAVEHERLDEAVLAEALGEQDVAEAILDEPVIPPVVHVAPRVAAVEGITRPKRWKAALRSKRELIKYVAQHPEWEHLLDVNMSAANSAARAQREALAIPGLEAICEEGFAVRA